MKKLLFLFIVTLVISSCNKETMVREPKVTESYSNYSIHLHQDDYRVIQTFFIYPNAGDTSNHDSIIYLEDEIIKWSFSYDDTTGVTHYILEEGLVVQSFDSSFGVTFTVLENGQTVVNNDSSYYSQALTRVIHTTYSYDEDQQMLSKIENNKLLQYGDTATDIIQTTYLWENGNIVQENRDGCLMTYDFGEQSSVMTLPYYYGPVFGNTNNHLISVKKDHCYTKTESFTYELDGNGLVIKAESITDNTTPGHNVNVHWTGRYDYVFY